MAATSSLQGIDFKILLVSFSVISPNELSQLWRNHASALVLLARSRCGGVKDQAEDCVQEAFIRLASQVPVPADCLAWLVRVVRNAAIDASRAQRRRIAREQDTARAHQVYSESEIPTTEITSRDVLVALEMLESDTREIVIAHIWNNLSFRQIADAFEISHATAHRRYEAGLIELRNALNPTGLLTGTENRQP